MRSERIIRTCVRACVLCARKRQIYIYFLWRREILSSKESPQKEQKSPFLTKSCLGKRAERSFFFTFFLSLLSLSSLFFKRDKRAVLFFHLFSLFSLSSSRERETLLKRKSPLIYTVERERGVLGSVVTHHGRNLSARVRVLPRRKRVRR